MHNQKVCLLHLTTRSASQLTSPQILGQYCNRSRVRPYQSTLSWLLQALLDEALKRKFLPDLRVNQNIHIFHRARANVDPYLPAPCTGARCLPKKRCKTVRGIRDHLIRKHGIPTEQAEAFAREAILEDHKRDKIITMPLQPGRDSPPPFSLLPIRAGLEDSIFAQSPEVNHAEPRMDQKHTLSYSEVDNPSGMQHSRQIHRLVPPSTSAKNPGSMQALLAEDLLLPSGDDLVDSALMSSSERQSSISSFPTSSQRSTASLSDNCDEDYTDPLVLIYLTDRFSRVLERLDIREFFRIIDKNEGLDTTFDTTKHVRERTSGSSKDQSAISVPFLSTSSSRTGSKRSRDQSASSSTPEDECRLKVRKLNSKAGSGISKKRLACLYHKHQPFVYRKNDHTGKLYEICATRDFENINRLL